MSFVFSHNNVVRISYQENIVLTLRIPTESVNGSVNSDVLLELINPQISYANNGFVLCSPNMKTHSCQYNWNALKRLSKWLKLVSDQYRCTLNSTFCILVVDIPNMTKHLSIYCIMEYCERFHQDNKAIGYLWTIDNSCRSLDSCLKKLDRQLRSYSASNSKKNKNQTLQSTEMNS